MISSNISKLAENLEKQELEAPNGIASPQVYSQLLAIYLYQNDLCNAKYLWKRIPQSVKTSCAELGQIWTIGQCMWQRDFPGIYKQLAAVQWSDSVAEIMVALHDSVRKRAVELITQAYSSIHIDTVAAMTGLTVEQTKEACLEKGWQIETDTLMVHPKVPPKPTPCHTSSEDQLNKLTNFVSFLEN